MAESEDRYVVDVRMIVSGKLRGAKTEKYVEKSNCGSCSLTFLNGTGLYVARGSWNRTSLAERI